MEQCARALKMRALRPLRETTHLRVQVHVTAYVAPAVADAPPVSLAQRSFAEALAVARRAQQRTHVSVGEYTYNYTLRGIPWYTLARRYKEVTLRCWVYCIRRSARHSDGRAF